MKRIAKSALVLALLLAIVAPLSAADKKKKKKKAPKRNPAAFILKRLEKAELTDEQQTKVKALVAEYGPKIAEASKKAALSKEQRESRAAALKQAKADGKKGKEARAAVSAAANLSDEQKAALKEAQGLRGDLNKAALALLTPEQKEKAGFKGPRKKKGKKKKAA